MRSRRCWCRARNFNKAAGAATGERSLETYFFGRYKSERGEPGLSSKPVSLRGPDSYSVLLCRFFNEALAQHVTLAQVFWAKAPQGPPARLFVIADRAALHQGTFRRLRRRHQHAAQAAARQAAAWNCSIRSRHTASAYRHRFGIENEQAMDLFHQTISMKSVGNLTDFVREHMLEASPVEERIQALIGHYQDLDRAHELVLKAKEQVGFLTPLVVDCDEHGSLTAKVGPVARLPRGAAPVVCEPQAQPVGEAASANLDDEMEKLAQRIAAAMETRSRQLADRDSIRQAIAQQGGDRIERIKRDIADKQMQKEERARARDAIRRTRQSAPTAAAPRRDTFRPISAPFAKGESKARQHRPRRRTR